MSEQSSSMPSSSRAASERHPERHREQETQQQAFSQQSQQFSAQLSGLSNVPSFSEPLSQRFSTADPAQGIIIEHLFTNGLQDIIVRSSEPSTSPLPLRQPYLQMVLRQAHQRIHTERTQEPTQTQAQQQIQIQAQQQTQAQAQQQIQAFHQRYPEGNQFIIQLPIQANPQPPTIPQQTHADQLLLQVPLQQSQQMLHVVNPANTNTQMFLQIPQLQANSNIRESSVASQQSVQTVQQNPQGKHLFTEPQCTNQYLQLSDGSQQQNVREAQQLLLQLPQQIPVLSLQQPLQQTQPLLVQVLQPSSVTAQQPCPEQNLYPCLRAPQQSSPRPIQRMPIQSSLQQVQSTPLPLQQSTQIFQQPNQATSSFPLGMPQEMAQIEQRMLSNQTFISSEQSVSQRIQQMLQLLSQQQPVLESMKTDSRNALLSQFTQSTQQQSNQQQMAQESQGQSTQQSLLAQLFPQESVGVSLQVSESNLQSFQQSSQAVQDSLEIPDVSLFDLSPAEFMRIIGQCPYEGPLECHQMSSTSSTDFVRESLLQASQESAASSNQESSRQLSRQSSLSHQIYELLPENTVLSNHNSTSQASADTIVAPVTTGSANETQETFSEDSHEEDETDCNEDESDGFISGAEANTPSISSEATPAEHMNTGLLQTALSESLEGIAFRRPENSNESHETVTGNDPDSTVRTAESPIGIIRCILDNDGLTSQEVRYRLANLHARIESLSNLMNNTVMTTDSS